MLDVAAHDDAIAARSVETQGREGEAEGPEINQIDGGGCVYMYAPHLCHQDRGIVRALGESVYGRPGKECGLAYLRVFSKHSILYRVRGLVVLAGMV